METLEDVDLRIAFEEQAIPHPSWKHRTHLRIAYIYLREHPFEEAMDRIRSGIQKLNAVHEVEETLTQGYHETMTRAWMHLVHFTMVQHGEESDSRSFLDQQPQLGVKTIMRLYYSRDRFLTLEAKADFVEPDLAAFPQPAKEASAGS